MRFELLLTFIFLGDLVFTVPFLSSVFINVPTVISITTTYPPSDSLVITPQGGFLFDPPSITFTSNVSSASFSVTPLKEGSYDIRYFLSGPSARLYEQPDITSIDATKCM